VRPSDLSASSRGFTATIDGRRIIVRVGSRSQTVSVASVGAETGIYDRRYRLPVAGGILTQADIEACTNLESLSNLMAERKADDADKPVRTMLPELITVDVVDPEWLRAAVERVEREITKLVDEFVDHPYLHRVEHSLHAQLFAALVGHDVFSRRYRIGSTQHLAQLVHKEWPETVRDATVNATKRGSFDLAVIAPQQLALASPEHLRFGRIAAPIVIEMGLNYGHKHLRDDALKLTNSNVPHGYLVHLSRDRALAPRVEATLATLPKPVKAAYAQWASDGKCRVKQLDSPAIALRQAGKGSAHDGD
jgi:hypothetical protein